MKTVIDQQLNTRIIDEMVSGEHRNGVNLYTKEGKKYFVTYNVPTKMFYMYSGNWNTSVNIENMLSFVKVNVRNIERA